MNPTQDAYASPSTSGYINPRTGQAIQPNTPGFNFYNQNLKSVTPTTGVPGVDARSRLDDPNANRFASNWGQPGAWQNPSELGVGDQYRYLFGRSAAPAEQNYWNSQNLGRQDQMTALRNAASPVDQRRMAVADQYRETLGRNPDEPGLNYWMQQNLDPGQLADALRAGAAPQDRAYANFNDPTYMRQMRRRVQQADPQYQQMQQQKRQANALRKAQRAEMKNMGRDERRAYRQALKESR